MKKLSILALFILAACYTPVDEPTRFNIIGFEELWAKFRTDAISKGYYPPEDNLIISFGYGLQAQCQCAALTSFKKSGKNQVTVQFDIDYYWNHPETRELIFYHEMGHAMPFHRMHNTYYSLMNPNISDHAWPTDPIEKDKLITELFHPKYQTE